ncbi:MAG: hypothetical protein A2139_14285 [Desulfobacca sp. RBG_16_60_12]|nr:MAG: hypothetical protein A2139_14285 [Desulfobacca sp. RBG_16_60_12]
MKTKDACICLGRVGSYGWTQETYETATKHAGMRARELRKLGYRVTVSPLGMQVTKLGLLRLTMVDVRHPDGNVPPYPEKLEMI